MDWHDDTLQAYADDELGDPQRSDLERAIRADAALAGRVAALRLQRDRLRAAYAPMLDEPMPPRLLALLQPAAEAGNEANAGNVASLDARRAARDSVQPGARGPVQPAARGVGDGWARWGGMAAALLLGVVLGTQYERSGDTGIALRDGRLVAEGAIGVALSTQLASAPVAAAPVAVQLSFVDKSGRYCRSFSSSSVAGLACRDDALRGGRWAVQALAATDPAAGTVGMRQAGSALPRAVLDAVDQSIAGTALDAAQERSARDAGWKR